MLNEINLNCDENMCLVCLFMLSFGLLKLLWDSLTTRRPCRLSHLQYNNVILPCARAVSPNIQL